MKWIKTPEGDVVDLEKFVRLGIGRRSERVFVVYGETGDISRTSEDYIENPNYSVNLATFDTNRKAKLYLDKLFQLLTE